MEPMNDSPFSKNLFGAANAPEAGGKLEERFIVPPFTLLDSTSETWRTRAAAWRFGHFLDAWIDPVLVEVLVRWFCPAGGWVFASDDWAHIADKCGARTWPIRNPLVSPQDEKPLPDFHLEMVTPSDLRGSENIHEEVYMYAFRAMARLKPNRFGVFVLPVAKNERGAIDYIAGAVILAAEKAGAGYLNEIIYAQEPKHGSGAAEMHKTILVFCKGDPRIAAAACTEGKANDGIQT